MRTDGQTGKSDVSKKIFALLGSYTALVGGCRPFGTTYPLSSDQREDL